MRLRSAVVASALFALLSFAVPSIAAAAPHHNRGLTINATPNPIDSGGGPLIYGQLNVQPIGSQTIVLYQHATGSHMGYTVAGTTTTSTVGFYQFPNITGVATNTSYFVREAGGAKVHSRTVYEKVAALVSLSSNTTTADTNTPITFSGTVTPNHAGQEVLLQQQSANGNKWNTIDHGFLNSMSMFTITHRWRVPGAYDVRAVFPGDYRNIEGDSDAITVTIQQAQVPGFTINSSSPIINEGQSAMISGNLVPPTAVPPPSPTTVQLWGRTVDQTKFHVLQVTTTGTGGAYSFTVSPRENTLYQVRTAFVKPARHTSVLFEGVRDVVTMSASSMTSTAGGVVRFTGTVLPDKAGHTIYLQRQAKNGNWYSVELSTVRNNSTFAFVLRLGAVGTYTFRARIYSDKHNIGGASAPISISAMGVTPPSTLPPAS
jgi:hypothetical protein